MTGVPEKLMKARWFPVAVAMAVVSAVVILFCWPIILDGRTIFHTHGGWPPTDETSVHLPLHAEIARQAAQGDFAVYNQWPAFGQSLAADPDALVFDPFMLLFRGAGTASGVLSVRAIVFTFIGALAVFGFLRLFVVAVPAAAVAAAVYAALVLRYPTAEELLVHYAATSWSMLGLFLLALAIRTGRRWAFPLAGLATGLSALAGHPQAAYFGLALGILYVVGEGWPRRDVAWRQILAGGAGWLGIALAVAAVQLVPLAAGISSSIHFFADVAHPELDEDLAGYVVTILGPGMAVLLLVPLRRRWLEAGTFVLLLLFVLTVMNTPIVGFWHSVIPFFDNFKLSSKYFVSPFPILASIGLGLAMGNVSSWSGAPGRVGLFVCGICALWAVWAAPFKTIYELQHPAADVEAIDRACVDDIDDNTPEFGRIVRLDTEALYPSLTVNAAIFDVQTSSSHIPERYANLMMAMNPAHAATVREDSRVMSLTDPAVLELAFWDVAGVTTLVSGRPVDIPGWELVLARPEGSCMYERPGYWLYRNTGVFERAFAASGQPISDYDRSALLQLMSRDTKAPQVDADHVSIRRYSPTRVVVDVSGASFRELILTDSWSPDWKAYVDGRPVPMRRAWYLFRSVDVPEGDHQVEFRYRPAALHAGLASGAAGVLAAVIWLITAVFSRLSARRKVRDPGSSGIPGSGLRDT